MINTFKERFININKDKSQVLKELLAEEETNTFGGWYDCFIAYNIKLNVFAIYKRYSYEDIRNIELYFNKEAELFIEETLEQYENYHTEKNGDKFIALHFHKNYKDNKNG